MENKIDINKKYTTRDGRQVRLFTTESPDPMFPVCGALNKDGEWTNQSWSGDGEFLSNTQASDFDLIEAKEKIKLTGFLNVYTGMQGQHYLSIHPNKALAISEVNENKAPAIAILDLSKHNIEFEEGEGL